MNALDTYKEIDQIELHYFFSDDSHSLDAFIRNKCETEFLHIIKEVLKTLEIDFQLETVAVQEGGLKEWWKMLGDNGVQVSILLAILTIVLNNLPSTDSELDALTKKNLELSIEKQKLEIQKLREEKDTQHIDIDAIVSYFNADSKVVKHRSNFFETLIRSEKITHIETNQMYDNKVVKTVKVVEKKEFYRYVVSESKLPMEIIEDARLEIISPVLNQQGKYKWKGIYKGVPIDFYLTDKDFKRLVFNGDISFHNGFSIACVLEIQRAIDELGELKVKKYSVPTVLSTFEGDVPTATEQGKKYLAQKKKDSSPTLFD